MEHIVDSFTTDHPEIIDCAIKGSVPKWLKGRLYRNGPAKYRFGPDMAKHLFDGMAVIHCYKIKDGTVLYHNRLLESDTYKKNKAANRIVVSGYGTVAYPDPCKSFFRRYARYFLDSLTMNDNDVVNLMQLGDQLYAMTETPLMNRVDSESLDRIEQVNWSKYVAVHFATAHPMPDSDGSTYNLGTSFGSKSSYSFIKIPPSEKGDPNPARHAELVGSIPAQWPLMPNYSHSFGMTENYLVFVEQPAAFNMLEMFSARFKQQPINSAMHCYEGYKTKIHVVHKYTGSLVPITYVAEPFFVYHHINAYEDGHHIVVDLVGFDDARIFESGKFEDLRNQDRTDPVGSFKRFVLPLPAKKQGDLVTLDYTSASASMLDDGTVHCVPEIPVSGDFELPQINYRKYNGKKYRFTYGIQRESHYIVKLVKFDIKLKTSQTWQLDTHYPGEPVFVCRPGAEDEDDGVLLSPVICYKDDMESFLLILDAKSFTEIARAEIPKDIRIPLSFHGIFTDTFQ